MINKILEKIINPEKVITKLMLLAGSFILILNQFTLEYLLFPESAVMCLGVLFNVIAIKFMVDNPKCKYIKNIFSIVSSCILLSRSAKYVPSSCYISIYSKTNIRQEGI